MKQVHLECLPDEMVVKTLGIQKRFITHHQGKSRVFHKLKTENDQLALVDEDPGTIPTNYEKSLIFIEEKFGIKRYRDQSGNKVLILKVKLEDWIIALCKEAKVDLKKFNLPDKPDDLHKHINQRLPKFEDLIHYLLKTNNPGIEQLKEWLQ
ncbi:MAG: hypothetical protein SF052_03890 [Bacteroidia bacterium]|nr:hypothetical protein [Bacteroidia bacterium]